MSENSGKAPLASNGNEAKTGRKKADMIASIVLIAFSAMIITQALSMKIMVQFGPGPGLFPLIIGIVIGVLSLSLLFESINPKTPDKPSKFQNKAGILVALKMFAGLIAYVLLINTLGYLIMTFLLVLYTMMVVEKCKIKTSLITAFSITLIMFLIFQVGLKVTLPESPFGF